MYSALRVRRSIFFPAPSNVAQRCNIRIAVGFNAKSAREGSYNSFQFFLCARYYESCKLCTIEFSDFSDFFFFHFRLLSPFLFSNIRGIFIRVLFQPVFFNAERLLTFNLHSASCRSPVCTLENIQWTNLAVLFQYLFLHACV